MILKTNLRHFLKAGGNFEKLDIAKVEPKMEMPKGGEPSPIKEWKKLKEQDFMGACLYRVKLENGERHTVCDSYIFIQIEVVLSPIYL